MFLRSLVHRLPTRFVAALAVAGIVLAGALIAGYGDSNSAANAAPEPTAITAAGPLKVGVVLPYTGPFGLYGKPMEATIRARFARAHNRVGNRPVQLFFEDEATDAKVAVTKVTKLMDQKHVNAVVCCVTGAATLAVGPILAERRVPQLGPIPNPSGLGRYSTAAVAAPTAGHDAEALGRHVAARLHYKTAAIIASDFSYGREVAAGFAKGFKGAGGRIVKQAFAPLGTQDFGSYLTQIGRPNVVFGGFAGADAIGFVKQYRKFKVKPPLVGHGPLVTELVLNAIGPAAVGIDAGFFYSSQLNIPENKNFIRTMTAANPAFVPSHFTAGAWAVGSVLLNAFTRADSGASLGKAIRGTRVQAPWGLLKFNPSTGYADAPTYYYTVVKSGGKLRHRIIGKIAG
jgi:branched-chain amino acid transport system substrate-binding protein